MSHRIEGRIVLILGLVEVVNHFPLFHYFYHIFMEVMLCAAWEHGYWTRMYEWGTQIGDPETVLYGKLVSQFLKITWSIDNHTCLLCETSRNVWKLLTVVTKSWKNCLRSTEKEIYISFQITYNSETIL